MPLKNKSYVYNVSEDSSADLIEPLTMKSTRGPAILLGKNRDAIKSSGASQPQMKPNAAFFG
jgi:hypothetical protein